MRRAGFSIIVYVGFALVLIFWDEWQACKHHVVGGLLDWLCGAFQAGFFIFIFRQLIRSTLSRQHTVAAIYGIVLTYIALSRIFTYEIEYAKMWARAAVIDVYPDLCKHDLPSRDVDVCFHYYYSLGWGFTGPNQWLVLDKKNVLGTPYNLWPVEVRREFVANGEKNMSNSAICRFDVVRRLAWNMYWISGNC